MILASWNVNSVRARISNILDYLKKSKMIVDSHCHLDFDNLKNLYKSNMSVGSTFPGFYFLSNYFYVLSFICYFCRSAPKQTIIPIKILRRDNERS